MKNTDLKYFKELNYPKFPSLYDQLMQLIDEGTINWGQHTQICLNTIPSQLDNFHYGAGSLDRNWEQSSVTEINGVSTLTVNTREVPLKEEDFTELCSQFLNTEFEEIFNMLKSKWILGRVRLMKSEPKTCLSWHVDYTPRLHYVIKTQPGCLMVIENEVNFLPENTWWRAETTIPHTAFNGSYGSRIHLVVCILGERQ